MEKHNNVKGKLIGGILAVVLPFLIIQGVIYELLQYGVIKTAIAFVLNAIVAAIAFFIIYNILKALLRFRLPSPEKQSEKTRWLLKRWKNYLQEMMRLAK